MEILRDILKRLFGISWKELKSEKRKRVSRLRKRAIRIILEAEKVLDAEMEKPKEVYVRSAKMYTQAAQVTF